MATPETVDALRWDDGAAAPAIVATAAWNALAYGAYRTWAFRRAEITGFAESPFRDGQGERATMAHIRTLPVKATGAARLQAIGARLVRDIRDALPALPRDARVAVVCCLPERLGGREPAVRDTRRALEHALAAAFADVARPPLMSSIARGHAGFAHALLEAADALARDRLDVVVCGGVDTYYDPDAVEALIAERRLFGADNIEGIIPGEGGAFVALATRTTARHLRISPAAHIGAVATALEPSTIHDDVPCLGTGLARAAQAVTAGLRERGDKLDWWLSDMTAEPYRVHEFQLAWPRAAGDIMTPESALEFLPVHLGDLGAAAMPTAAVVAVEGLIRQGPRARNCAFTGTGVGQERGAVLLMRG